MFTCYSIRQNRRRVDVARFHVLMAGLDSEVCATKLSTCAPVHAFQEGNRASLMADLYGSTIRFLFCQRGEGYCCFYEMRAHLHSHEH
jgi:hypothetical protein